MTKWNDQAAFTLQRSEEDRHILDEIRQYQHGCYIRSIEAAWRILEQLISQNFQKGLAIHLENGQGVVFNEENALDVTQRPPPSQLPSTSA